jgi:hypothetical protein
LSHPYLLFFFFLSQNLHDLILQRFKLFGPLCHDLRWYGPMPDLILIGCPLDGRFENLTVGFPNESD